MVSCPPFRGIVRQASGPVSSLNLGRPVETPGGFLFGGELGGERFVRERFDHRAERAGSGGETRPGLIELGIKIERPVKLDLDRVNALSRIGMAIEDMPARIGRVDRAGDAVGARHRFEPRQEA